MRRGKLPSSAIRMNVLTYYNIMHGGFLITFVQHAQPIHYNLEVQANTKKNGTKKPMLFLASMGETALSHDLFFKFSVGPVEVV